MSCISRFGKKQLNFSNFNSKVFYMLVISSALFIYPVIYGGGIYVDDLYRIQDGQFAWMEQARPLADFIARIYSLFRISIVDPTPFNWFFCIIVLAVSAKLVYMRFSAKYSKYALALSFLFIVNPYFIQNVLYRFDSMGMVLALFFGTLAFCINDKSKTIKVLGILLCLNFYQPMSNIFIGLMAIEVLLMFMINEPYSKVIKFIVVLMLIFTAANVLFFVEVKLFFPAAQGRSTILPFNHSFFIELILNYVHALLPYGLFWGKYFAFIIPAILLTVTSIIKTLFMDKDKKLFIGYLLSCSIVLFSSLGFMGIMKYQMYMTEVRAYTYFPITLMFMAVAIINFRKKLSWLYVLIPAVFACFIFSAHVGNLQKIQSEFEKPIFYGLTIDIDQIKRTENIITFYSIGDVAYSKFAENIVNNTPFNGYLTRWSWNTTARIHEYGVVGVPLQYDSEYRKELEIYNESKGSLRLVLDRPYYKIYVNQKYCGWIVWSNE